MIFGVAAKVTHQYSMRFNRNKRNNRTYVVAAMAAAAVLVTRFSNDDIATKQRIRLKFERTCHIA